ncbi:MAG: hypothetical protein Q8L77_03435 [Nitrospirota bacterium]|nr:hypothetical protein [Nitrospirota bacterium]
MNTLNEFGKDPWFYHITVRAARITAGEVMLVVRGGEDNSGDRGKSGVGSESLQEVAAVLAAEIQIQENEGGEGVREA